MYYKILVSVLKYMRERKKNSPRVSYYFIVRFDNFLMIVVLTIWGTAAAAVPHEGI